MEFEKLDWLKIVGVSSRLSGGADRKRFRYRTLRGEAKRLELRSGPGSAPSREQALVSIKEGWWLVCVVFTPEFQRGDTSVREYHTMCLDGKNRCLMNNWPTSKVVRFDERDQVSVQAARDAIKHTDWAFFRSRDVVIHQLYRVSLLPSA